MKKKMLSSSLRLTLVILLSLGMIAMPQRNALAAPNVPVNADFEQGIGVGWSESSSNGFDIVWNASANGGPAPAHGGAWIAYLGDANNETSKVWQSVTIAPNTHMSFWYWTASSDSCGFDFGYVVFNSIAVQTWNLCNSNNTYGWVQATVDLSAYAGQTGNLEFSVVTNASSASGMLIDDIVFYDIFADTSISNIFLPYIKSIYNAGITGGCGGGNYCPDGFVTRAQMAVFLLKGVHTSAYTPPAVGGTTNFSDVPISYWAAAWVKQLAAEGITGGCGGGNYCPDDSVTRAQMAVFLLKAKHGISYTPPATGGSTGFADVPDTYWAAAWIKQLAAEGITSGCTVSTYCPDNPVTRAQMAVFLVRTFNLP